MRDKQPALILYVAAVALAMIAKVFEFETLMLVSKPIVVPAIYYFYLQAKREKINLLFSVAVWSFFVADMIVVLYSKSAILSIMVCGMISYSFLTWFGIKDAKNIKFNAVNVLVLALLLLLPSYMLFRILNLDVEDISGHYSVYLLYGIILLTLVGVSIYNYISNATHAFLYLCIASVCMLLSDLFYCVYKYMIELPVFENINLFAQLISYFFMVKYFISRRRTKV